MKKLFIGAAITVLGIFIVLLAIARSSTANRRSHAAPASLERPTPTPPVLSLDPAYYRLQLETDYLRMINEVNHNYYNHVTTRIKKSKRGYELFAYHSFFGQYEFQIGHFGKEVSAWIDKNRGTLNLAKITRVGVHGTGAYATGTYYDLR